MMMLMIGVMVMLMVMIYGMTILGAYGDDWCHDDE